MSQVHKSCLGTSQVYNSTLGTSQVNNSAVGTSQVHNSSLGMNKVDKSSLETITRLEGRIKTNQSLGNESITQVIPMGDASTQLSLRNQSSA